MKGGVAGSCIGRGVLGEPQRVAYWRWAACAMGVSLGTANTPLHFSHHGRIAVECLFISVSAVCHGQWATEVFVLAKN